METKNGAVAKNGSPLPEKADNGKSDNGKSEDEKKKDEPQQLVGFFEVVGYYLFSLNIWTL